MTIDLSSVADGMRAIAEICDKNYCETCPFYKRPHPDKWRECCILDYHPSNWDVDEIVATLWEFVKW